MLVELGEGQKEEKSINLKAFSWEEVRIQKDAHHNHPHKVLPNRATVYTPEADGIKTFSTTSCLIELVRALGGSRFSAPK